MHLQFKRRSGVLLLAAGMMMSAFAGNALAQEFSAPEKILFLSKHFSNVKKPTKIAYSYRQEAAAPEGFSDDVTIDITKNNTDGTATVSSKFLSGDRQVPIAPLENAQGNPVILGFLERDITEMKRVTGGATPYFRKRIRLALAAPDVPVKNIDVMYDGRKVAAQEITIFPYASDPLKDRFEKLGDKGYVFVVSNAVPGSLYRVYTILPVDKAAPVITSSMTIAKGEVVALKNDGLVAKKN